MKEDRELLQQIEAVKRELGLRPKVRKLEKKLARRIHKSPLAFAKAVDQRLQRDESSDIPSKIWRASEFVTVADLAQELKRDPLTVRVYLRNAGVPKPSGRWKWPAGSKELRIARKALGLPL